MTSDGPGFRAARKRAGSALLAYLERRNAETQRALLAATRDLEAAAVGRPLSRISPRGRASQLARLAVSR